MDAGLFRRVYRGRGLFTELYIQKPVYFPLKRLSFTLYQYVRFINGNRSPKTEMGAVKLCDRGSPFCSQNCPDPAIVLRGFTFIWIYGSIFLFELLALYKCKWYGIWRDIWHLNVPVVKKTSLAISAFWPKCTDSIIPLNDGKSIFRRYMQNLSMPPLLSTWMVSLMNLVVGF